MKNYKRIIWFPVLLFIFLLFFFSLLYFKENKYKSTPPYGRSGVMHLTQSDLTRKKPIFLTSGNKEYFFIILSCTSFGMGLLLNLFFSNLFEPILFFWQFEWCGLFSILLFGSMMVVRNKRILKENKTFQTNLEEMVEQRTEELKNLLEERKTFFSDMAHALKTPLILLSKQLERAVLE